MNQPIPVSVQLKRLTETAIIPTYGSALAAGFDLHADIQRDRIVYPGEHVLIPTGIAVALPAHLVLLICPRSGLSAKSGVTVHNGPGVIDADYRGGIGVVIHNTTHQQFVVKPGDRIAQGVIVPVFQAQFEEVEDLPESGRGAGGFGSTGVSVKVDAPVFHTGGYVSGSESAPSPDLPGEFRVPRTIIADEIRRQCRPGGMLGRSPAVELGYRAMRQEAFDRARAEQKSLPSSLTKWLDAEPEEAAVGLQRERMQ